MRVGLELAHFCVLFRIVPICPEIVWGFSRFFLVLFLGPLTAPMRNSPERVRDTIRTFPAKKWKTPWFAKPLAYLLPANQPPR